MKKIVTYLIIIVLFAGALSGYSLDSFDKNSNFNPAGSSKVFKLYYHLLKSAILTEGHVKM